MLRNSASLIALSYCLLGASAQAQNVQDKQVEEVVVTGSYIRGTTTGLSPVLQLNRADIETEAPISVGEIVKNLPLNTGSEFNSDIQGQGGTLGTTNVNLRGLGVNSTLVLINGIRQTEFTINNASGETFVDVNTLAPVIALENVTVLKDGASALYGSDAVAGVVNFVTRRRYDGLKLEARYGSVTEGSQSDYTFEALFGTEGERSRFVGALSVLQRTELGADERSGFTARSGLSTVGFPGSFQPVFYPLVGGRQNLAGAPTAGGPPLADPFCGDPRLGGVPAGGIPGAGPAGACGADYSTNNTLVPEERRFVGYFNFNFDVDARTVLNIETSFGKTSGTFFTTAGFPILQFPVVPANNPGNTFVYTRAFGPPGSGQFTGDPAAVRLFGRLFGPNDLQQTLKTDHTIYRTAVSLKREFANDWYMDASVAYSRSSALVTREDIRTSQFLDALACRAGPNRNLCYNPFANARFAAPGSPQFNTPEVIALIKGRPTNNSNRDLLVADVVAAGTLADFMAGPLSAAVGAQFRRETLKADLSDDLNNDNFLFFRVEPDFKGDRAAAAVFAELQLKPTPQTDVQLAGRYERYEGGESSFDPKLAASWSPTEWLSLRSSVGTSFRAPSLFQIVGSRTAVVNITDPVNRTTQFRPVQTTPSRDLSPESARTFTLGATVRPASELRVEGGYWRFEYSDRILRRNPQGLVNANPNDPRISRDPLTNEIVFIRAEFFNAAKFDTDGLDLTIDYRLPSGSLGDIELHADATYILTYRFQEDSGSAKINGVANRNDTNIGAPAPRTRANLSATWTRDNWRATTIARYISRLKDDQPGGGNLDAQVTVDGQIGYRFAGEYAFGAKPDVSIGVINIFDNAPPRAVSPIGYEARVYDPRGRVVWVRLGLEF